MEVAHLNWFLDLFKVTWLSSHQKVCSITNFGNNFYCFQALLVANTSFEDSNLAMGFGFYCVQPPQRYRFCLGLHHGAKDYQTRWKSSILVCHSLLIQRLFKVRCVCFPPVGFRDMPTGRYFNQMLVEDRRCRMIMCSTTR